MIKCKNKCPLGKFDGCCTVCPEKENSCPEYCGIESAVGCPDANFDEESGLQVFQSSQLATMENIATVIRMKKEVEEQEKILKSQLCKAMEKYGIKKFESNILNLTYVAATTSTGVDSAKLKKKYPEIFSECSKTTSKAAYVRVELNG